MRKLQWMVLALLLAWGAGLAAGLLADDEPALGLAPDDGSTLLAMGPGADGPGGPGEEGGGPELGGGGPGGGRMMQDLGLSQDQKDQLKALRRARRSQVQAAQNALQDAREDLRELMDKDGVDDAKLKAKHADVQKLQAALEDQRFQSILEVRAILTPEQRKKMKAFMQRRPGRGRRRGAHPGQGGKDDARQPGGGKGGPHGPDGDEG